MSEEKVVTHADLYTLRRARGVFRDSTPQARLLDRLIAAAEADPPPLPEGWVVERNPDGESRIVWHKDGVTSMWSDGTYETINARSSSITPLRPTVTEADVEKAAYAIFREREGVRYEGCTRDAFLGDARAAFKAAGIEVTEE